MQQAARSDQQIKIWNLGSHQRLKLAAVCVVVILLILCLLVPGSFLHRKLEALDIRTLVSSHKVSLCQGKQALSLHSSTKAVEC